MDEKKTRGDLPLTDAEAQAAEAAHIEPLAEEMVIDLDYISIPRGRYDELLRSEAELGVLRHAYQVMRTYSIGGVMDAVFNPKFKYKEGVTNA